MIALWISALGMLASIATAFFVAPEEASQGIVQKIFYIHVSSAMTMYLGFFISFLSGIFYLAERKTFWDELGCAASEVGWLFCLVVLLTGPLWARPIWGTFWTWEPRLTTTFLLFLIYSGYLFLRNVMEGAPRKPLASALIAIIAFIDVPLIHYSVKLWRGVHPTVLSNRDGLPRSMSLTLAMTVVSLFAFFSVLCLQRMRLERMKNAIQSIAERDA